MGPSPALSPAFTVLPLSEPVSPSVHGVGRAVLTTLLGLTWVTLRTLVWK